MQSEIWIVSGSMQPTEDRSDKFTSGIDGYDIYIRIGESKYKLTNTKLEQFKIK